VKWFLIGSVCLFSSATWVRGDAASDLYNQGAAALQNNQFALAAQDFDQIITNYPINPHIDDVHIRAGYAYWRAGEFAKAINRLSSEANNLNKPAYRATALYFTAMVQFSQGLKNNDKTAFQHAVRTLTTLIDLATATPTPDNKGYLETGIYYRALSQYERGDYADAEKDLIQLTQSPPFSSSLSRPDYLLLLGSVYAVQANQQHAARKHSSATIRSLAEKALDAFEQAGSDPNALVQANEANMSKAEVLFLLASLNAKASGYQMALEAFRLVRRKDDMIPLQENHLDELRQKSQAAMLQNPANSFASDTSLVIDREEGRLNDLKNDPDPIIHALIRIAECYVCLKQPDEARTILHRLIAYAPLTPDQRQEVDFQTLYSYVLGGQTAQADKALTDYLNQHKGDPQAEGISVQIAGSLMDQKDYAGALQQAERSLRDFPNGKYVADAISLKVQALTALGRIAESNSALELFLQANPTSPEANSLILSRAQNEANDGDLTAALADYKKVRDNGSAGSDLQASAEAGYIQTLNSLKKFDDVIAEARNFPNNYPSATKQLPSVLLLAALALEQKNDPATVPALQDIVQKYPKDDAAPFALYYLVVYYVQTKDVPAMIQAASDLNKAYPDSSTLLMQAADAVSAVLIKQNKFDDAIALYQPQADASKPDIAAMAHNKIAGLWLASANSLGHYQSMTVANRAEAEKRLDSAEQAYLGTLKNYSDQPDAVGDALDGLVAATKQRRSWGLLKDGDLEDHLAKLGAGLTSPDMPARLEMAKAGLVFVYKDGVKQYPAALDRFKKVIDANPSLRLTRQETDQYGELLLAAKDYPTATKTYQDLLDNAATNDQASQGDAYYGLGAVALGQGNVAGAKDYFLKLESLPGGGLWHPHILDANYGIALADEQSTLPADNDAARQIYSQLMLSTQGGVSLQAKAMLGYGRLLEKSGNALNPTPDGPNEYAVHYYQEPHTLFGLAAPAQSAEGLFDAGLAYAKAGDTDNAKKQFNALLLNYADTAPDWAAKAQSAEARLGP
jgi:tetratricopeptide (TPR) repeat protein